MTKLELVRRLNALNHLDDPEQAHIHADELLLKFINDKEISDAFEEIDRWYA